MITTTTRDTPQGNVHAGTAGRARSPMPQQQRTCSSCRHWQSETPYLGACTLGWAAHDGPVHSLTAKRGTLTEFPHGGLPLPLTSHHHACNTGRYARTA